MEIDLKTVSRNLIRLINQLWKLLPMRENNENWKQQLEIVILEISGIEEIGINSKDKYLILLSKLKGLQKEEVSFEIYRKTIFDCISLLQEL